MSNLILQYVNSVNYMMRYDIGYLVRGGCMGGL